MNELDAILEQWRSARREELDAVLATVVHVEGSAYRRPGARMMILPDGRRVGSISGGCLEGDVSRKAWWLTENGRPAVRVYDTTSDEDVVWEYGLGCNGVVHVMLERTRTESVRRLLAFLGERRAAREAAAVATVIRVAGDGGPAVGERLFVAQDSDCGGGALLGTRLGRTLGPHLAAALRECSSRLLHLDACDVFVEWIGPAPALVVLGAGHDAVPLVAFAKQLGWHVTVADGRPAYARIDRFPGADRVVLLRPGAELAELDIGTETAVVVMTHNFPQDARLLRQLAPARPRYLGLLGSRRRTQRLLAETGADGAALALHAPVGLDIGAETPEVIALAIVAEIQATLAGREGAKLRLRSGPIHAPVAEVGVAPPRPPAPPEAVVCELADGA